MLKIKHTKQFDKDLKLIKKRNLSKSEKILPAKFKDHELHGEFKGFRECHIKPDWLGCLFI
jgi:mRNA interferase YafQ